MNRIVTNKSLTPLDSIKPTTRTKSDPNVCKSKYGTFTVGDRHLDLRGNEVKITGHSKGYIYYQYTDLSLPWATHRGRVETHSKDTGSFSSYKRA